MSKRKVLAIDYDTWWQVRILIDYNNNTLNLMFEQVMFWSGGQLAIAAAGGDVERAYLNMLCAKLIELSISRDINAINEWLDEHDGWRALDAEFGVEILSISKWEFEHCSFRLYEQPIPGEEQDEALK